MMTPLAPLLQRFADHMQSRRLSPATQKSYIHYVTKFARYHGRSPEELESGAVREYQLHLLNERHHSADSANTFVSAARFLYLETLKMPWNKEAFSRTPLKKRLSAMSIPAEVRALFRHVTGIKHRAALILCYGAGITATEAVALKTANIDSSTGMLCIENRKGSKIRYVPMAPALLDVMRTYWLIARPTGQWLFPSWRPARHIGAGLLRRACKDAWINSGLTKQVSSRNLRRSFAACLVPKGDQPVVQAALERSSIDAPVKIGAVPAQPLDRLLIGTRRQNKKKSHVPKPENPKPNGE